MDFAFVRIVMRMFKSNNRLIIDEIMSNFSLLKPNVIIAQRTEKLNVIFYFRASIIIFVGRC